VIDTAITPLAPAFSVGHRRSGRDAGKTDAAAPESGRWAVDT
jgi:hypothetical protein